MLLTTEIPEHIMTENTPRPGRPSNKSRTTHVTRAKSSVFTKYIGMLEVRPQQQSRVPLGTFGDENPAKGFSITLNGASDVADAIVTKVLSIGTPRRYELVLQIANNGSKSVTAEMWRM